MPHVHDALSDDVVVFAAATIIWVVKSPLTQGVCSGSVLTVHHVLLPQDRVLSHKLPNNQRDHQVQSLFVIEVYLHVARFRHRPSERL